MERETRIRLCFSEGGYEWFAYIAAQRGLKFQKGTLRPLRGRGSRGGKSRLSITGIGRRALPIQTVDYRKKLASLFGDLVCDIPEDLLLTNLHEELQTSTLKKIYDASYCGGCLSYMNLEGDTGVLIYPSGQTMDQLNIL
ncbi:uncharacterized protein LOC144443158 [Glandiceps talaboti]